MTRPIPGRWRWMVAVPAYAAIIIGITVVRHGWIALLGLHAVMLCVLLLDDAGRRALSDLRRGGSRTALFHAATASLCAGPLVVLLWPLMPLRPFAESLACLGLSGWEWTAFSLYYVAVNPWIEEAFWRGYLATPGGRPAIGDLLFAGYHGIVLTAFVSPAWCVTAVGLLTAVGWFWRQIARKHDGLIVPAVAHWTADLSLIAAAWML